MSQHLRNLTLTAIVVSMLAFQLVSCSEKESSQEVKANKLYHEEFAANNFTGHESAQPIGDLFATVKHFDLTATGSSVSASASSTSYSIYQPAFSSGDTAYVSVRASVLPGEGIPGIKPQDSIPIACQGLVDDALGQCIEEVADENISANPVVHSSHFDTGTLSVLFGEKFADKLVDKIVQSSQAHVDSTTRNQVAVQLSDFINDLPGHMPLDLLQYDIFERKGYSLTGATLTDDSRGDIDGDGALDRHSTVMIQISKEINYNRSSNSELDAILQQYLGFLPRERYIINLQAFIHLKSLHALRQRVAPLAENQGTPRSIKEELAQLDLEWEASWINKSLDANILKMIAENPDIISWDSCEYTLSFQIAPENVMQHLTPALEVAIERGDAYGYNLLEQHLNAQTAILTGSSSATSASLECSAPEIKIFYQVSRPRLGKASGINSGWDYAMIDDKGNRIAIYDPTSGKVLLAEEPSKLPVADPWSVVAAYTKSGACKGDKSNWAYWPSQARTGNFGRGINWIFTESLVHNQVGDYKNIHWYQSAWKSAAQVAIKSGMWVVKNYLKYQFAGGEIPTDKTGWLAYYISDVVGPYLASYLGDGKGGGKHFSIAGHSYTIPAKIPKFWETTTKVSKNQTFAEKVGNKALGFLIDRVSDGVGQSLDVTITGWQDYSDGSHYGCFAFSY